MKRREFLTISLKLGAVALIPQPVLAGTEAFEEYSTTLTIGGIEEGSRITIYQGNEADGYEHVETRLIKDTGDTQIHEITMKEPPPQPIIIRQTKPGARYIYESP